VILIPDTIQSGAPTQREPYGVDLFIDPATGDLDLVADDLATVRGARNLEQALTHRLHTRQGETPILTAYGLPLTIGERVTTTSAGYLSAHIREQLARDPRVDRVNVIEVSDKGDHLSAALQFTARAGGLMTSQVRL
jgi:predicted component of type VI protein secretion system